MVRARVRHIIAQNAPKQLRKFRYPQMPFNVKFRPMEMCPFMLFPVLPGETMTNLLCQYDVVTDPVVSRLLGWHYETYVFYVPHRALQNPDGGGEFDGTQDLTNMHLSQANDLVTVSHVWNVNNVERFVFKGGVDWVGACMNAILQTPKLFRDEDDFGEEFKVDKYPLAYAQQRNWLQSAAPVSVLSDDPELPGVDDIEDLDVLGGYTAAKDNWERLRDSGEAELTYDDYLRAQGVKVPRAERLSDAGDKMYYPELVRMDRTWVKPVNHIDPTDGSPTTAVVVRDNMRADKRRFFKEPGFIFGFMILRPKIFLSNQKGLAAGMLTSADHWRPKTLQGYPYTGVKLVADSATEGPLQNQTQDYVVDVADLFMYGEEFFNHAITIANHGISLPLDNLDKNTLTLAQLKSFFVDSGGTANLVNADGITSLDILSPLEDTTP